MAQHVRGEFVTIEYVVWHSDSSIAEVHAAVARGELPPPTPNAVDGKLVWEREEVFAWVEKRGMKQLSKAFNF